jgi:hypothetical protein
VEEVKRDWFDPWHRSIDIHEVKHKLASLTERGGSQEKREREEEETSGISSNQAAESSKGRLLNEALLSSERQRNRQET